MAAKDYIFVESAFGNVYLAKRTTRLKNVMSQDRRLVEDNEIIGMFEKYLRRFCEENGTDTFEVSTIGGKKIFEAKLIDKEDKK